MLKSEKQAYQLLRRSIKQDRASYQREVSRLQRLKLSARRIHSEKQRNDLIDKINDKIRIFSLKISDYSLMLNKFKVNNEKKNKTSK